MPGDPLLHRHLLVLRPADYIGLYLIVIAATVVTVNILYRIHF